MKIPMLRVIQAPNPVLSQKAKPVLKIDKTIRNLINEMVMTLNDAKDPEGVGLAAPQVGKSLQIFIIKQTPKSPVLIFINPIIEQFLDEPDELPEEVNKKKKGVQLEGCLSLYNVWGVVKRQKGVILSYTDENEITHKKTFHGFMATIIQHEFDHLQGILFPKRVLEQRNQLYHSSKDKNGEMEFEEIEL
jgi:peptide deformylase